MTTVLSDVQHVARKPHQCGQCGKMIQPGERYRRQTYVDCGDFNVYSEHVECGAAAAYYAKLADLYGDEWPCLCDDVCPDDHGWLMQDFPIVAGRLGIQGPIKPAEATQ